jgi:hypothetical protein
MQNCCMFTKFYQTHLVLKVQSAFKYLNTYYLICGSFWLLMAVFSDWWAKEKIEY